MRLVLECSVAVEMRYSWFSFVWTAGRGGDFRFVLEMPTLGVARLD